MISFKLLSLAAAFPLALAQVYQGFNYGSTNTDSSVIDQSRYTDLFNTAKGLVGHPGFTSARLYTLIQGGTTDTPTEAIPAAIDTQTSLLLGLWASAGPADFTNELNALTSAISTYGQDLADAVVGISVGSEDLYRISPTGIENGSGAGADPATIAGYLGQVRSAIANTPLSGTPVGHVDTWTAWVNSSNDAVINACDFIGMDAYPYFQTTEANSIDTGNETFFEAYYNTTDAVGSKPVWVTETGWPVSGPQENLAVASVQNAQTYWDQVGCTLLGSINTWWYTLQDAYPDTPSPSFGLVGAQLSTTPVYNLTCSPGSPGAAAGGSSGNPASSAAGSGTATAVSTGSTGAPASLATAPNTLSAPSVAPGSGSSGNGGGAGGSGSSATDTGPGSSAPPSASGAPATGTASANGSCPSTLSGEHQYPHLIVPISSANPNKAYGTSYNGTLSPSTSSIFNFDFPASYAGQTCSLIFLLPEQSDLATSNYQFDGSGGVTVSLLSGRAGTDTTYANAPYPLSTVGGVTSVSPGNSYQISQGACPAGQRVGYEVGATGSLSLDYFQDHDPSPIGLFSVLC